MQLNNSNNANNLYSNVESNNLSNSKTIITNIELNNNITIVARKIITIKRKLA